MLDTKPCITCGGPAIVRQNRWERTKYCSSACGARARGLIAGEKSRREAAERRAAVTQPRTYRLVPLTKGAFAKVDVEDFEVATSSNWACSESGYARRTIKADGLKRNERLHRIILERVLGRKLLPVEQVDHVNGDRLDNRRANLRVATHNQNSYNVRRKNKHGYMGVSTNHARFCAKLSVETESVYVGTFDTPDEAAWMRDQWAVELHGEFASLNFDYQ